MPALLISNPNFSGKNTEYLPLDRAITNDALPILPAIAVREFAVFAICCHDIIPHISTKSIG